MRKTLLATVLVLCASTAQAQHLFSPVYIKKTSLFCRFIGDLQYRERLQREQRTESLQTEGFISQMVGNCGVAHEGQWMFFQGFRGNHYVCLRPRRGADCVWLNRNAIGDIPELFPGRTLAQGNRRTSCAAWSKVVQRSLAKEADMRVRLRAASRGQNLGTEFMQNVISGALGVVTGGPTTSQVTHAKMCVISFAKAQGLARRLTAYHNCPSLAVEHQPRDRAEYQAVVDYLQRDCMRN